MNCLTINKISDLQQVIEKPIYLSGKQSLVEQETCNNMWVLNFSNGVIKILEVKDLEKFIQKLLKKRNLQLSLIDPKLMATFYLWFDKQALQLRFNLISGCEGSLPFSCKLNKLSSLELILYDFIVMARKIMLEGDTIEFFDPTTDIEGDTEEYVLDVYVRCLGSETSLGDIETRLTK